MSSKDNFGDRMKVYERLETDKKFMKGLPIYIRLDGRGFSKFTKGLERPFCAAFTEAMQETTKSLVEAFNCKVGYTQSDEISLIIYNADHNKEVIFGGKIQKLVSALAAHATVVFYQQALRLFPTHTQSKTNPPRFDCRAFQLPSEVEAANAVLWREQDATKNSVSMLAHHHFEHGDLQSKNTKEMIRLLEIVEVDWSACPTAFKRGTYFQKKEVVVYLTREELEAIPTRFRPSWSNSVTHNRILEVTMPPMGSVANRTEVLIHGIKPILIKENL